MVGLILDNEVKSYLKIVLKHLVNSMIFLISRKKELHHSAMEIKCNLVVDQPLILLVLAHMKTKVYFRCKKVKALQWEQADR